ncbi:MAG: SctD/MshK family protein [Rhizobiaceae bacterium]
MTNIDLGSAESNTPGSAILFNWVTGVAAVVCVLAVTVSAIANLAIPSFLDSSPTDTKLEQQDGSAGLITRKDYLESFAWAARIKLEDFSLQHSLTVTATNNGGLLVNGMVFQEHTDRYEHFKQWYLGRENFPPLQEDIQFVAAPTPVPELKSVWFGETAIAFFNDGSSGSIGETIGNGWKILKIEETGIVLEQDGSIVSMEY